VSDYRLTCIVEIPKGGRNKVKGWAGREAALEAIEEARRSFLEETGYC
jgi:hypothetical protein